MKTVNEIIEVLKLYINKAHGDGYDTVEIPIETSREILLILENSQKENIRITELENKMILIQEMTKKIDQKIDRIGE